MYFYLKKKKLIKKQQKSSKITIFLYIHIKKKII